MACMNDISKEKKLRVVLGDGTVGIHGKTGQDKDFSYLFTLGGLESLAIDGKEWLYRSPRPTFWRALTDNDRGNRLHLRSGMWLAADMFQNSAGVAVRVDGREIPTPAGVRNNENTGEINADTVSIVFRYETITVPAASVEVTYTVDVIGQIQVDVYYHGQEGLPELPVFGMRFVMPTKALGFRYEGLSGETYPDRMAGGIPGVYEQEGLPVTPYLVPQDCGVHMDTKWLEVCRNTTKCNVDKKRAAESGADMESFRLRFAAAEGQKFAFSCLPYTAEELENATHQEELPLPRRTVVCILGAVRGVGGINSWGADVESAYHIDAAKDIQYGFVLCPV